MSRIDDIKKRIENYQSEYIPYFESNGEMREWNEMFKDIQYLLSRLEIAIKTLEKMSEFECDHRSDAATLCNWADDALEQIRK